MSEIFFISDTHYAHKNICRGTSEWKEIEEGGSHQTTRDFKTLEEMNYALVSSINEMVSPNDVLYHLGDWSFGGEPNIKAFRDQLNCRNIHLIFGNHDQHIEKWSSPNRKLFVSADYYKEITIAKTRICMFHYAQKVWNKSHHGSLHLYGHSHGNLPDPGNRSMDVGVDTNNLYPYTTDEIFKLKERPVIHIDHHTSKTN